MDWAYLYLRLRCQYTAGTKSIHLDVQSILRTDLHTTAARFEFYSRQASRIGWWHFCWVRRIGGGLPGRYGVYTYDGERKVAQVEYEVAP